MQRQVKKAAAAQPKAKFRKAHPMSRKSKGISRDLTQAVTKSINKKIEREMSARAGKFKEPMTHLKSSQQAMAKTGWIKPGKIKGSLA